MKNKYIIWATVGPLNKSFSTEFSYISAHFLSITSEVISEVMFYIDKEKNLGYAINILEILKSW